MRTRSFNRAASPSLPSTLPQSQLQFEPIISNADLEGNTVLQRQNSPYNSIFPGPYRGNLKEALMLHQPSTQQDYTNEQLNNLMTVAESDSKNQNMSIEDIIYLTELKLRLVYIQKERRGEFPRVTMLRVNYIIALIGTVLNRYDITGGKKILSRNSRRAKKNKTNKRKKRKSVNNKKRSGKKI